MSDPQECPECGTWDTERVHSDIQTQSQRVIEVRICNDCPTEYEVEYGDPLIEVTHTEDPINE